jgi:hypothetical protein
MTELHPSNGHQTITEPLSETRRVTNHSERHPAEHERATGPLTNRASRLDWAMIQVWSFAIFSFAALIFALNVIWAKCCGDQP